LADIASLASESAWAPDDAALAVTLVSGSDVVLAMADETASVALLESVRDIRL
jgi:hypothetical protein